MTQLTASVETETGYRFMNMMVNSSEIKDGDVFTVSGPMVVTANYVEKKDLASLIDKTTQTVVYNKQYRNFEVKITGYSGLDFKVAYSRSGVEMTENPKSAGTYKVRITRGEDDLFKAVDVTAELIIKKAGMALLEVPTIGGDNYEKVDAYSRLRGCGMESFYTKIGASCECDRNPDKGSGKYSALYPT